MAGAAILRVAPGRPLAGSLRLPGDKSVTHRALICAALAEGQSAVHDPLDAADTRATAGALAALGADIEWRGEQVRIVGTGGQFRGATAPLDLSNSGTGLRLLAGALAGAGVRVTLTGDASLRHRPMTRVIAPLEAMGAHIESASGRAPLALLGGAPLRGIRYRLPVASAQVKSAILLAGLGASGETVVEDSFATRDHTERMLPVFGADLRCADGMLKVRPGTLAGATVRVPGDISSAAFLMAAALLVPGSDLILKGVGINPTRIGLVRVLQRMGARIEFADECAAGGEPIGDLRARGSELCGTRVTPDEIPSLIDELPVLMVLAANASGPTVIEGAGELRHKESDRIATMQAGLAELGVELRVDGDALHLDGGGFVRGGRVEAAGDHRVAMALCVAGLAAPGPVEVAGAEWIATSFPDFPALLARVGATVDAL